MQAPRYSFGKWYTRIIGVFFVLVVISLISDYAEFGFRAETMHKIFHVILGVVALSLGLKSELWWRAFPIANGSFFLFVAFFGVLFPDFGGLDAFNSLDTVLHAFVGASGVAAFGIDNYRRASLGGQIE